MVSNKRFKLYPKVFAKSAKVKDLELEKDLVQEPFKIRTRIDKLNNENFNVWQLKMELVLDDLGLWNDEKNKPKACRKSWKEIMFAIEDNQFVHVEKLKDGEAAWDALAKHHEKSGLANKINVLRNLFNSRFESGTIEEHCATLVTTQRKLKRLAVDLGDDIVIAILLNSLPSRYDSLVYAWDAVGEDLKLDDVISKLKIVWL